MENYELRVAPVRPDQHDLIATVSPGSPESPQLLQSGDSLKAKFDPVPPIAPS